MGQGDVQWEGDPEKDIFINFMEEASEIYTDWDSEPSHISPHSSPFSSELIIPFFSLSCFLPRQMLKVANPNFLWQSAESYVCTFQSLTVMLRQHRIWTTKIR